MIGVAGIPQITSCGPLALLVVSKLVGSRLRPHSHAQDGCLGQMDQAAPLCAIRDCRSSLTSSQGSPPGKPRATFWPSRLAVCLLHVVEEVTEELIPEEHEASGQGSLQQAGGQALEEALCTFLPQHLLGTIQEALVASNLGRGRLFQVRREVITMWMMALLFCQYNAWHVSAPDKYLLDEGMHAGKRENVNHSFCSKWANSDLRVELPGHRPQTELLPAQEAPTDWLLKTQ